MSTIHIRDWPWEHVRKMFRVYGAQIQTLALRGEQLALQVRYRYQYFFDHPADLDAKNSLCDALEDYLKRDQRDVDKIDLANRFDHGLRNSQ